MDNQLRAIILKLQNRLSEDDRLRLHFFFGNYAPKTITTDLSLRGTLNLMNYLFEQDTIDEQNFTFLINAFEVIQCNDAARLLREHLKRIQSNELNQSFESLFIIMPPKIDELLDDQEEDKYMIKHLLVDQKNTCGDSSVMINNYNTNINEKPIIIENQKASNSGTKRKHTLSIWAFWKCLLLFALLLFVACGILIFLYVRNINNFGQLKTNNAELIEINQQLKTNNSQSIELIQQLKTKTSQSKETIQQLKHDLEQCNDTSIIPGVSKSMVKYGSPHGGPGGGLFDNAVDFKLSSTTHCIGIELFWDPSHLASIRFIYQESKSSAPKVYHGRDPSGLDTSFHNETFMMQDGERINKVTWYTGIYGYIVSKVFIRYVLGIQFSTTAGRMSALYGSEKGDMYTESPEGFTLGYAKGRSGLIVDMLQFVWHNQEIVVVEESKTFTALCPTSSRLLILTTIYQSKSDPSACSKDVTSAVRKKCSDKYSCSFVLDGEDFTHDLCDGRLKELQVTYTCSNLEYIFGPVVRNSDITDNNIHLNSTDYIENVKSIEKCGQRCLTEPRCVEVVYASKPRLCWLKQARTPRKSADGRDSMAVLNRNTYL